MTYPKRELEIIPECNDENDNPTCWAMLVGKTYEQGDKLGCPSKSHFIWICKYSDTEYVVENSDGYPLGDRASFKTLWGAKRAAEGIAWRQDETGCYSD